MPPIRMISDEDDFINRIDDSFIGVNDNTNNDNKSVKYDCANENENGYENQIVNETDAGMEKEEEEANKIIHLPLDSLFEENKSCQQTLINFGR